MDLLERIDPDTIRFIFLRKEQSQNSYVATKNMNCPDELIQEFNDDDRVLEQFTILKNSTILYTRHIVKEVDQSIPMIRLELLDKTRIYDAFDDDEMDDTAKYVKENRSKVSERNQTIWTKQSE